jgi:1,4-dihydroxy-6-naphthoate synthase
MQVTIGFSPCPNDTFIFDALVNKKIDTKGIDFKVYMADVQALNEWAKQGKLDFSKISYGVLPLILQQYRVLTSGGALGKGVGPLLISKVPPTPDLDLEAAVNQAFVAIPGKDTTAHLMFSLAFPKAVNKEFMLFHHIESAVLSNEVDAGVIIHENRFTYQNKGLVKWMDLGEYWEQQLHVPIPLGGIVAHNRISTELAQTVNSLIKDSLVYALDQYTKLPDYVIANSQELSDEVMRKHIDLYVNNYTICLGTDGKKAVMQLLKVYADINHSTSDFGEEIFIGI